MTGGHLSLTWALLSSAIIFASLGMQGSTGSTTEWNAGVQSPAADGSTSQTPTTSEASSADSFSPGQLDTSSLPPTTSNQTAERGQQGLSPGEAAGVAIGTIAGVAAAGGGIFAALKFSGRLGG